MITDLLEAMETDKMKVDQNCAGCARVKMYDCNLERKLLYVAVLYLWVRVKVVTCALCIGSE